MKTYTPLLSILLTLAVGLPLSHAEEPTLRDWTNHQGKSMQATFVKLQSGNVTLERPGGKKLRVPLTQLSREDQVYARSMTSKGSNKGDSANASETKEAPAILQALFGDTLYNADNDQVPVSALSDKKKIGIYFSAHWCPPCRAFTPELVKTYNTIKDKGESFEIVFVSSDRDKRAMFDYMEEAEMPWLAVKHQSDTADALKQKYNVKGIPKLVVIDDDGGLLTENARGDVTQYAEKAYDKW